METPLVTIGMPVYNEAKYIAESLENLLKLTYPNLEILIADNGSMDGTSEICASFATQHPQFIHIRHRRNIGQNNNFNYLPNCASGKYFFWASGHDLFSPTFVEDSVAVLEGDPAIVLAYPRTINITKEGQSTREKVRPFDIRSLSPDRRFREVMWRVDCNYVYGVWRLSTMLRSKLFQLVLAPDRVFLAEMAMEGTFAPVNTFKYYRMNRERVQTELEKRHRLMNYLYPHRTFTDAELTGNHVYAPTLRAFRAIVQDSRLPWLSRWKASSSVWLCGVIKFHLFPGADTLSMLTKKFLPARLLTMILRHIE